MFFSRFKNFIRAFLSVGVSFGVLLAVWSMGATSFPQIEGERTYYLCSKSSQALVKNKLSPLDFVALQGESVTFSYSDFSEVECIMDEYNAEVLFTESAAETTSYYCYSPRMRGGVKIGKYFVNLHIAVRGERCAVGSPMIFGGF